VWRVANDRSGEGKKIFQVLRDDLGDASAPSGSRTRTSTPSPFYRPDLTPRTLCHLGEILSRNIGDGFLWFAEVGDWISIVPVTADANTCCLGADIRNKDHLHYAESSTIAWPGVRDHPRVCGEHILTSSPPAPSGDHPRVRGEHSRRPGHPSGVEARPEHFPRLGHLGPLWISCVAMDVTCDFPANP
jgi:hypothetical protein